ncbi:hypothetical protein [Ekhidna sp.]|uniref:hypothetical protein n=1 Tax=Ekhidna sp. TaxID=2608089 RepID=UPI003CCBFED4
MKSRAKFYIIGLLIFIGSHAQSPGGFNYQAVVRNNSGEVLVNQSVGIRMSLIQGSTNGSVVYSETFAKTTNSFGLIDLIIGQGNASTGSFSTIDWAAGPYFLETAIDQNGGSNYSVMGTSQLMSVPFAMYAASAANDGADGEDGADGKSAYEIWLEAGNTGSEEDFLASLVGEEGSPQDIALNGTELSITDGSTVDLSEIDTDTNTQLTETEVDDFVSNNGYLTTETQDLALSGSDLSITGGSTIDLSTLTDFTDTDTQLSEEEVDAFVANNGYLITEVDGDITNEIQDLTLTGTELSISDGSTVDLAVIDTDTKLTEAEVDDYVGNNGYLTTETQDLTLAGSDLSITGGTTIDLSTITNFTDTNTQLSEAEVDAYVANNGYITSFTEADGDVTNELQDISLAGTELSITDGSTIDLSGIDTNTQLSEAEVDAFVANDGYLTSFTEVDGDVTNELQTLSVQENGELLTISGGNTVILSDLKEDITNELITTVVLNGTDLEITEAGGTITTDLSSIVDDADADPTNELNTTIVLNGTNLETTDAGGTISTDLLPLLDAETDPVFAASDVSGVTSSDITSWDEAATWGNHADQNYLTNETQNLSDVLIVSNDAGGEPITNLEDPTNPQDAATKAYVDALEATVTTLSDALSALTTRVDILEENWAAAINAGVNGRDLLDEGATVQDLVNEGLSVQQLLNANITVKELLDAGKVAAEFNGATYQGGLIFDVNEGDGTGKISAGISTMSTSIWTNAISYWQNITYNSFDDWMLPSVSDLALIYNNLHVGGYGSFSSTHWSTTEVDAISVYYINFNNGFQASLAKDGSQGSVYSTGIRSFGGEVEQLIIAGETIQDLFDDGFTYGQLYAGGRTIDELESINPSPSVADLLIAGVSPVALYNNDNITYSYTNQFASGEATYEDLYNAGVSIDELEGISPAPTITDLRSAGVPATELYTNDATTYSYQNLYDGGYTIDNLEVAGADINVFITLVTPLNDLYENDPTGDYTIDNIFSTLPGDTPTNLQAMLDGFISLYNLLTEYSGGMRDIFDLTSTSLSDIRTAIDDSGGSIFQDVNGDWAWEVIGNGWGPLGFNDFIDAMQNDAENDLELLFHESDYTAKQVYDALVAKSYPDPLQTLFDQNVEMFHIINDPALYDPGPVTLSDIFIIRQYANPEEYLFNNDVVTHQEMLDLGFTAQEIYIAEDLLDDQDDTNESYDLTALYGLTYSGGIIFYTDDHFLNTYIASSADLSDDIWGCSPDVGGDGPNIGDGDGNTTLITDACGTSNAAGLTRAVDGDGSWWLPSEAELLTIYNNIPGVLSSAVYWSSTDGGGGMYATAVDFSDGSVSTPLKSETYKVRAVKRIGP